jgi:phospholipid/cholesterol/gamma-HCH transport system ATP-binding protein
VFDRAPMISNLDLDENILLGRMVHDRRPSAAWRKEALEWARFFGWDELPETRPAWLNHRSIRQAQWIRALLGRPALLLLARPAEPMDDGAGRWIEAVARQRERGAAVLWITADRSVWADDRLDPAVRWTLESDGRMTAHEG